MRFEKEEVFQSHLNIPPSLFSLIPRHSISFLCIRCLLVVCYRLSVSVKIFLCWVETRICLFFGFCFCFCMVFLALFDVCLAHFRCCQK